MGWAKYYEDNAEIMCERNAELRFCGQEIEINAMCVGLLPVANIIAKTKEHSSTPRHVGRKNRYIVCKDCGQKFLFSVKSQSYFDKMDWNAPKRCKRCKSRHDIHYLMHSSY